MILEPIIFVFIFSRFLRAKFKCLITFKINIIDNLLENELAYAYANLHSTSCSTIIPYR